MLGGGEGLGGFKDQSHFLLTRIQKAFHLSVLASGIFTSREGILLLGSNGGRFFVVFK